LKVLSATVTNFGSYKELTFDFSDTGLALVQGATGSGKSTLQDIVPWVLFGITAKDGNVDEVRSWNAGDLATWGQVTLQIGSDPITDTMMVTRIRGSAKENDLFIRWPMLEDDHPDDLQRGKDLADTQKLINEFLGVNADTYCTAATFNEFSESGLFFLAKPKDKRLVFEKVANVAFPAKIASKTAEARKSAKRELEAANNDYFKAETALVNLNNSLESSVQYASSWDKTQLEKIVKFTTLFHNFEKEKTSNIEALETKSYCFEEARNKVIDDLVDKLDSLDQKIISIEGLAKKKESACKALPPHCPTCGKANNTSDKLEKIKADIEANNRNVQKFTEYTLKLRAEQEHVNPYKDQIAAAKKAKNHYSEQLADMGKQANPFKEQLASIRARIPEAEKTREEKAAICNAIKLKHSSLDQLHSLSFDLRGILLKNAVKAIQDSTNGYLERYFDSEFKVGFELLDADSLNVDIQKNGYPCVYKQLSKGQRQLLKLCFSVSVMRAAANNAGISFNLLCFDEAISGLDSSLKSKAYGLFESLAKDHASVLVVEHDNEFQELFSNRYKVQLVGDESQIEHE
jgi:DNA repair exonuclease SbcCD ATPase subunit